MTCVLFKPLLPVQTTERPSLFDQIPLSFIAVNRPPHSSSESMPIRVDDAMTVTSPSHAVSKPAVVLGAGGKELPAPYK